MIRNDRDENSQIKITIEAPSEVEISPCANVGLAVEGILPDESGIRPLVVNVELYEMSPPPGNRGGAVSGAAPCPIADWTQSDKANNSNAHRPQEMRSDFVNFTRTPPVENG